jgi:hypothetical protein
MATHHRCPNCRTAPPWRHSVERWFGWFGVMSDLNYAPSNIAALHRSVYFSKVIPDHKLVTPNFSNQVQQIITLPTNEDDIIHPNFTGCHRGQRYQIPALDAAPHRTTAGSNLDVPTCR